MAKLNTLKIGDKLVVGNKNYYYVGVVASKESYRHMFTDICWHIFDFYIFLVLEEEIEKDFYSDGHYKTLNYMDYKDIEYPVIKTRDSTKEKIKGFILREKFVHSQLVKILNTIDLKDFLDNRKQELVELCKLNHFDEVKQDDIIDARYVYLGIYKDFRILAFNLETKSTETFTNMLENSRKKSKYKDLFLKKTLQMILEE